MRIPTACFGLSLLLAIPLATASDSSAPNDVVAPGGSQCRLAQRGDRLVVAFLDESGAPAVAVSQDSGRTFAPPQPVPIPSPLGAPDVAFTAEGDLLVASGSNSAAGSPLVVRSSDGGRRFSEAYAAYKAIVGTDPHFAVDAGAGSPRTGSIYLTTWDYPFDYYGGLDVGSSSDGGATFHDRNSLGYDFTTSIAVGPDGDLYVAYRRWGSGVLRTYVARSTGSTGPATTLKETLVPVVPEGAGPLSLAVDRWGVVHLAFAALPANSTGDRSDVFYTRSTDQAATFHPAVRLNDDAGTAGQTSPRIALAPDGTIAVSWRDHRNDPTDDAAADVYMSLSRDGGITFGPNRRVSGQTWLEQRSGTGTWSSTDGVLLAGADALHAAWTDASRGVLHARLPLNEPPDAPDFGVSVTPYAAVLAGRTIQLDVGTWAAHGFAGDVRLAVEAPDGPEASLEATTLFTGERTILTLAPDASTAPGVRRITLAASSGGVTRRADLHVNVYAPSRDATVPANVSSSRGDATTDYFAATRPGFTASGALYVPYADDSSSPGRASPVVRRSLDSGRTFGDASPLPVERGTSITICPSGILYALRPDGSAGGFALSRSTDAGATFSVVFTPPPKLSAAAFACAPDGSAAVVWSAPGSAASSAVMASISRNGVSFASPVTVESGAKGYPSLLAAWDAQSRSLYVLATRVADSSPYSGYQATVGRLFTAEENQPFRLLHEFAGAAVPGKDGTPSAWMQSLALDTVGTVHVGWTSSLYGSANGYTTTAAMASASQDGANFRDVAMSGADPCCSTMIVTPAGAGEAIAVWTFGGKILYARSLDSGRTYGSAADLSASPGSSSAPSAAASPSGDVFVTWTDTARGHPQVFGSWIPALAAPPNALAAVIERPAGDATVESGEALGFRGYGTGAALLAPHWDFGDGASADEENPSHVYDAPGSYTAVFTVTDPSGRSASASRRVTARAPVPSSEDSELVLPVVADTDGRNGSRFTTEVTLVSRAASPVTALLQYTAVDGRGSGIGSVPLEPAQEMTLPDVLEFLRERGLAIPTGGAAGSLRIVFRGARLGEAWAFARTSTPCGAGRCGVAYGAARASALADSVVGLQENQVFRSNLALVNLGDESITLRVTLLGPSGEMLRVLPDRIVPAFGWAQIDRPLLGLATSGRAVVTRVAGTSPFSSYGVLNDQTTSDGSLLPPVVEAQASDRDRLLPVVLDATGLAGSRYLTELTLANLTDAPLPLTLSFGPGSSTVTLEAGQQIIEPDAIAFLRRIGVAIPPGSAVGSLLASAPSGASGFAILARTYASAPTGGTYGASYAGFLASESAASAAWVFGLREDVSARSNLGLVNRGDAGDAIRLEISFFDSAGTALGAPLAVTLAPYEWYQVGRPLAASGAAEGYAKIVRTSGASRFVAYGVRNDAATNDGSILPMTFAP